MTTTHTGRALAASRNRSQLATDYDVCAARVTAADIDESKLRLAREAGADETVRSGGEALRRRFGPGLGPSS